MIRPHSPTETPAEKPAHSGEGGGAWTSPWALDHEWQEAPMGRKTPLIQGKREANPPKEAQPLPPAPVKPMESQLPMELSPEAAVPNVAPPSRLVTTPRRPRVRVEREASWSTLVVLSMGLLVFVFVTWEYLDDPERGSDEDLRLRLRVDQTATIQTPAKLRKFLDSVVPFEITALYGKPPWLWDTPTLSRIVHSNGAALDNLRDLLEDANWHPVHAHWHAADPCVDPRWQMALRLKQVEAAYLSRRMQEEEAFTAAIDLAELGMRLEEIWAWPSCYERSLEAQTCASQTLADLLRQTKLPEATLRQFQRQFSECQPTVEMLASALKAFYVHEKKLILGPKSGELADTMPGGVQLKRPGRLFFKPNETLQLFAKAFRQLKEEVLTPLAHTSEVRLKEVPNTETSYHPNSAGNAYFIQRTKLYTRMPQMLGQTRTQGNLIIALFAIRRCMAEKKTLPTTLEQLRTMNYLLDVPLDPYTGAPLQYTLTRGLIWSVGNDLKSSGGEASEPPMSHVAEPTVEIGIAVAGVAK